MKSYLYLLLATFLAIYTYAMPLAWAPPFCTEICQINPASGQLECREECIENGTAIPEPSSMALMAIGIGGAALMRRKRNK